MRFGFLSEIVMIYLIGSHKMVSRTSANGSRHMKTGLALSAARQHRWLAVLAMRHWNC